MSDVEALQELADVERQLRASSTAGVELRVGPEERTARLYFDTWEPNDHHRGTLLAGAVSELATSDAWEVVTILDPLERDENGLVASSLTIRREGGR